MKASPLRLSWRVFVPTYESEESFAGLCKFLAEHRSAVDEVAFFETYSHHLYFPLPVFAERADLLAQRIASLKAAGIPSVGINVLCTIGHVNEGWSCLPPLPFQPMVGHDGAESLSCACPNTPEFRHYIRAKYRLMAAAGPDFIWVDDDIRLHHHGVAFGCFCPTCLALFAEKNAWDGSREALVTALDVSENGQLREAWVTQNAVTLESLLADVAGEIRAVNPRCATGLMTAGPGWGTYSGYALKRWYAALGASKGRPGGGFYADGRANELVGKIIETGRQVVPMPAAVTDRQYELENYPYCRLDKSVSTVMNECALALAVGMNGIAFNALGWIDGRALSEREPLARQIARCRPYWEEIVRHGDGLPVRGLWPAWDAGMMARRRVDASSSWWQHDRRFEMGPADGLAELGIPLALDRQAGDGTVLTGCLTDLFTDEQLTGMLAGGLLIDTTALEALHARGLGEMTGVRIARRFDSGVRERFTDDPLNGEHGGSERYVNIEFWGLGIGQADALEPVEPGVRVLSELIDYLGKPCGPTMTAFENRLGGRVVVTGFAPWVFQGSSLRRAQMQNVADWITRGRLPLRIQEMAKLVPVLRLDDTRTRGTLVLFNAAHDAVEQATLHLRIPETAVYLFRPGAEREAPAVEWGSDGGRITITGIAAWSTLLLTFG